MRKPADTMPPGPRGRWPVGNSYDYDRDRIGFLRRCQADYGDIFTFSPATIFVADPELIGELFKKSNELYLTEESLFPARHSDQEVSDHLDGWMRARGRAWHGMTRNVVRSHGHRVTDLLDERLASLSGRAFHVVPFMRSYSAKLSAMFCFGLDNEAVFDAAERRSGLALPFMDSSLTFPSWLPLPSIKRVQRAEAGVNAAITEKFRQRKAAPHETPDDLIDLLLTDDPDMPSEDEAINFLTSMILASFGSPGATMAWVIREMARRPEVRERLREEALAVIADSGGLANERSLPYADAVTKEVMRLYPPTWLMGRKVRKTCTFGGYTLRPGMDVRFSPYLIHRDPRFWPDAEEFRPERWLEATQQPRFTYFPFGAGPRVCLGMHLGIYQAIVGTAHIAAHYDIEGLDLQDSDAVAGPVLEPLALRVRMRRTHAGRTVVGA
ncbi:cytochrome P450 [Nonomuraea sp. NPDC051941]|uniref:cytochrome P450 n=1 Tax=Nonomuraea sp. NPDC051941 TaxID=3364373 RepID=UPI0037C9AE9C